jgi:hypothetical protein
MCEYFYKGYIFKNNIDNRNSFKINAYIRFIKSFSHIQIYITTILKLVNLI